MTTTENIPAEWLTEETTVDLLREKLSNLPVSMREKSWRAILTFSESMKTGDRLWRYSSSEESWERKCGSAGLAIVREGKIVAAVQLIRN